MIKKMILIALVFCIGLGKLYSLSDQTVSAKSEYAFGTAELSFDRQDCSMFENTLCEFSGSSSVNSVTYLESGTYRVDFGEDLTSIKEISY